MTNNKIKQLLQTLQTNYTHFLFPLHSNLTLKKIQIIPKTIKSINQTYLTT